MTRHVMVVLVSTDPNDKVIKAGPFRQNADAPSEPPEGFMWLSQFQASSQEYSYNFNYQFPSDLTNDLHNKIAKALVKNREFLDLESPTDVDFQQQVRRLTRQVSALIRLQIGALDTIDGT